MRTMARSHQISVVDVIMSGGGSKKGKPPFAGPERFPFQGGKKTAGGVTSQGGRPRPLNGPTTFRRRLESVHSQRGVGGWFQMGQG